MPLSPRFALVSLFFIFALSFCGGKSGKLYFSYFPGCRSYYEVVISLGSGNFNETAKNRVLCRISSGHCGSRGAFRIGGTTWNARLSGSAKALLYASGYRFPYRLEYFVSAHGSGRGSGLEHTFPSSETGA